MRDDKRLEFGGALLVVVIVGGLFVLFAAASIGAWAWILVGVVGLVLLGVIAARLARYGRPGAADVPRPAVASDPSTHRVLVVVDDSCPPEAIRSAIGAPPTGRSLKVFVVAPALGSRLDRLTGDDAAYERAAGHLDVTLQALAELGDSPTGKIGSHDPIQAIDEALREFPADEIVVAAHPDGSARWLEEGVVDAARARYEVPVRPVEGLPAG